MSRLARTAEGDVEMSLHDLWGGKRTGVGKRWQVRYREAGRQHKRNFDTKEAALTFEARRRLEPEQRLAREGRALNLSDDGDLARYQGR